MYREQNGNECETHHVTHEGGSPSAGSPFTAAPAPAAPCTCAAIPATARAPRILALARCARISCTAYRDSRWRRHRLSHTMCPAALLGRTICYYMIVGIVLRWIGTVKNTKTISYHTLLTLTSAYKYYW